MVIAPQDTSNVNSGALIRHALGEDEGYLVTWTANHGEDQEQRSWEYPVGLDEAIAYLRDESEHGRDAYFGVALYKEPGNRRASNVANEIGCLRLDYDGYKTEEKPEDLPDPTAFVVSSRGSYHLYWKLSHPIPKWKAAELSRRLARWVGSDSSPAANTAVLRVPGTTNYKRDDPHEVTGHISGVEPYDPDEFDRLVPQMPTPEQKESYDGPAEARLDLDGFLGRHGVEVLEQKYDDLATKYAIVCPWATEHTGGDTSGTYIGQFENGSLFFKCHHGHCEGRGWREFRIHYEPESVTAANTANTQEGLCASGYGVTDANTANTQGGLCASGYGGRLPDAPVFPVDALQPELAWLVLRGAESLSCSPDFIASAMLAALGSAAGKSRVLRVRSGWREYADPWIVLVGGPGSKKDPALKLVAGPVLDLQDTYEAQYKVRKYEYEADKARREQARAQAKKGGGSVPKKGFEEPVHKHAFVKDITIEALAARLSENPRGLLVYRGELSALFASMDQYKPKGKGSERQEYLDMWSNGAIKVDRKGDDPIYVKEPVLSIMGAIQPDVLTEINLPTRRGDGKQRDDGMVHRFLFTWPERLRVVKDWGREIPAGAELRYKLVHRKLCQLQPNGDGSPVQLRFTPAGEKRFVEEKETINLQKFRPGFPEPLGYAWDKLDSQLARISLVLCLVRCATGRGEEAVTGDDVDRAARILRYFMAHTRRVYVKVWGDSRRERWLWVLNELLDEHGERWKVRSGELRETFLSRGVYDVPERTEEFVKELMKFAEDEPWLSVEGGKWIERVHRALEIRRTPPDVQRAQPPYGVDGVGVGNADDPVATDLVLMVLEDGPMFPAEIADATGLAYGTVKKVVSQLRKRHAVVDTGEEREQSQQVMLPEKYELDTSRTDTSRTDTSRSSGGKKGIRLAWSSDQGRAGHKDTTKRGGSQ